jgi:PA-IL-like protein
MHLTSKVFRFAISFCLILSLSVLAFADTIRLKDGSIIKGKIVNFGNGQFTVAIGEGTRQRQMTFTADEIESIAFDSNQAATKPAPTTADYQTTTPPANKVITIGQANKPTDAAVSTSQPPPSSGTEGKAITVDVKVLADNTANGWTTSGWVVKKGQRVRITGDGRVSLGNGRYSTPAGISSLQDNEKLLKNVATGALIAVIGDDNNDFILVGESVEFVAERDGALFLGVNEGNLDDNSGAFNVKVEIILDAE